MKKTFIAALLRLMTRVQQGKKREVERWLDGFNEYVDRMMDTAAIGDPDALKDPRDP